MKILTSAQIKDLDRHTIANEPISSIDLMERACMAFVNTFVKRFGTSEKIAVICGTGNNGGDGCGVARMLAAKNYDVAVWVVRAASDGRQGAMPESADFKANLARLPMPFHELTDPATTKFGERDVIIDAIFGSGLSRPASGVFAETIKAINAADCKRVSIDLPSGLFADSSSSGEIVQADFTISFQLPKLAFMFPSNARYVGQWEVVDIGLSDQFINEAPSTYFYTDSDWAKSKLRARSKFSHKGDFGHAIIIAGSKGKMGACVLASRAALRTGAGLLTTHVPGCGYEIMQSSVPEAMVSVDPEMDLITVAQDVTKYRAVGIGPGLGTDKRTAAAFSSMVDFGKPMVIDADALNILSAHPDVIKRLPSGCILTPHPGEFERLVGKWSNDFERLELQKQLANKINGVVILKGAHTSVASSSGDVFFNGTGNPGMATGGSGDVLTGVLTALVVQGYSPIDAAIVGVFSHGRAGDLAASEKGGFSLIASDIVEKLPASFTW